MKLKLEMIFTSLIGIVLLSFSTVYAHAGYGGGHREWHEPHGFMSSASSTHITSSGTSDCMWNIPSCRQEYGEIKSIYLQKKSEQIAEEAAQGKGPYMAALAQLMSCSDDAESLFFQAIRTHYQPLFVETKMLSQKVRAKQILVQLDQILESHSTLRLLCQTVVVVNNSKLETQAERSIKDNTILLTINQ